MRERFSVILTETFLFINFKVFSFDHLVYFIINLLSKCLCSCSLKGNFSPMHAMNNEIDSLRRSTCIRKEFPEIKMLICFKNKVAQRVHEKTNGGKMYN